MSLKQASSIARPIVNLAGAPTLRSSSIAARSYATNNKGPESRRRSVTPFNDDGHVQWGDLSAGEKASRATQQTFNFGMVAVGLVLTVRQFVVERYRWSISLLTLSDIGRSRIFPLDGCILA